MPASTPVAGDTFAPERWLEHRFGLSPAVRSELSSRAFWITGGGTGFGHAVATALVLVGARVVLSSRRRAKLEEAAQQIASLCDGGAARIEVLPLDLTIASDVDAVSAALQRAGITGLVHCAALPEPPSPAPLLLTEVLPRLMSVNLEASWRAARTAVQVAAAQRVIRVVLYSSEAAWHFTPGFGPYNISKAAVNNLGGSLAEEAAALHTDCDVQINVLNPGEARSEMNRGSTRSPYAAVPMTLALLGQPPGGPNGCFFHADGRHLSFGARLPWPAPLLTEL